MLHVESAKYHGVYKIEVTFNDGSSHLVDFEKVIFNDVNPEMIEVLEKNLEINGVSDGFEIHNVAFEDLEVGDVDLCVIDAFPGMDIEEITKKAEKIADNVVII